MNFGVYEVRLPNADRPRIGTVISSAFDNSDTITVPFLSYGLHIAEL